MPENQIKRIGTLRYAFLIGCVCVWAIVWMIVGNRILNAFLQTSLGRRYDEFLNHLSARTQTLIVLILAMVLPGMIVAIDGIRTLVEWRHRYRRVQEKNRAAMEEIVRKARGGSEPKGPAEPPEA